MSKQLKDYIQIGDTVWIAAEVIDKDEKGQVHAITKAVHPTERIVVDRSQVKVAQDYHPSDKDMDNE